MIDLLRRAWDALDSFKQAYPENWHEDYEQVMVDLMRADLKLSGVKLKWVGLTDEEILAVNMSTVTKLIDEPIVCDTDHNIVQLGKAIEAKLKEKNT